MDKLELYAKEKEQEAEDLVRVVVRGFKRSELTGEQLKQALRKSFKLGHHAGHCRGENHKLKLVEEELG